MGYVGWGLVAEQANTTTGGAQRTVGITSSPGAGIAQSSLNSVNNGGGGVVNNYGAVWDNLFVRQYLFGRGEQGAWFDPSDFQPNWRRNLLTWSEQFDNAVWNKGDVTVSANATTAPDGTLTAESLVESATAGRHFLYRLADTVSGTTYTLSVRAKNLSRRFVAIGLKNLTSSSPRYSAVFDLVSGVVSSSTSTGSPVNTSHSIVNLGDGWFQLNIAMQAASASTFVEFGLSNSASPSYSEGMPTYTGDGTSGIFIWGAQLEVGSTATAYQPITDGIVDYLTYQPQPILYQDSAGTTPVTALEQPCGLMLDKSKGLQLGPELVTNGDFSAGTTGWATWNANAQMSVANGQMTITQPVGGNQVGVGNSVAYTTVVGRFYVVALDLISYVGANPPQMRIGDFNGSASINGLLLAGTGRRYFYFQANTTATFVNVATQSAAGSTITFDNISVRELPGNHAYQTTSAKRPVVSARVNLLTYTEQFDNAAWTKSNATVTANGATAPDGTATADLLTASVGVSVIPRVSDLSITTVTNTVYSASIYVRPNTYTFAQIYFNNQGAEWANFTLTGTGSASANGSCTASISLETNGFYRIQVTYTAGGTDRRPFFMLAASGSATRAQTWSPAGTESFYIWGADFRPADQATGIMPRYQRVGAATSGTSTAAGVADYDSVGFPVYLRTDGTDDAMLTNSIDFGAGPTNPPIIGPELVVNGTFDTNTTGWTALSGGVLSVVGGQLKVENSATFGRAWQAITVTANRWYEIRTQAVAGTANATIRFGNSGAGSSQYVNATNTTGTFVWRVFATATTIDATLYVESASVGATVFFDNVSVREIDAAYAPDKVTVFAGVRKLSDAAQAVVTELSATIASNNGTFLLAAPDGATNTYGWDSKGTTQVDAVASTFTAPITNVVTGIGNISGDSAIIRVNGVVADTETGDQGTGNYGNYPLYLFARNQTSLYFTGNFYGLIVRGAQTDTSLITTTEEYIANVTGFGAPVVVGTPSIGVSI